jgi:protein-tyrosine phosphatase
LFSKFFKNPDALPDFSALGVDIHSHLLPGIDDGAPDMETALQLIRGLLKLGYKRLYTTPHVIAELYPNTRDLILKKRDEVWQAIDAEGLELEYFDAAAEYMIDEQFVALMKREALLTLPGNRVLLEMVTYQPSLALHQVLFDLQMKGYKPVIAHPERYRYYSSAEDFENLKQLGCEFQTNILSLTGYYNKAIQANARTLLQHKLIDFLGTDLHHARHLENLTLALSHKSVIQALNNGLKNQALLQ